MTETGSGAAAPEGRIAAASGRLVAGQYRLLRELGRGGMGVVWLAEDELLARQVAVKELRPLRGLTDASLAAHRARALREARSVAKVKHPGAVTLHSAIAGGDDSVYLIMEFVDGPTLAELIGRHGAMPAPWVQAIGLQLLDVLQAAHAQGIVHRDVKPGNIIITRDGQAKLTDFGIAYSLGELRLTSDGVMGTRSYLAPELCENAPITPAADLWALGATLYHAVEGRAPFDRDSTAATLRAILLDPLPVPDCDAGLAAAIGAMLHRDPAKRVTIERARALLRQGTPWPATPELPELPRLPTADAGTMLPAAALGGSADGALGGGQDAAPGHPAPGTGSARESDLDTAPSPQAPPTPGMLGLAPPGPQPPGRGNAGGGFPGGYSLGRRRLAILAAGLLAVAGVAAALVATRPFAGQAAGHQGGPAKNGAPSAQVVTAPTISLTSPQAANSPHSVGSSPVSIPSSSGSVTTRPVPPPAPVNLKVSSDNADNINLSWTAPAPGLWYFVHYEDTHAAKPAWKSYLDETTTAKLQYLPVGHTIAIYVTAANSAGQGRATPTRYAKPYVPPPAAPQGLTAISKNAEVDLSWTAIPGAWYYVYYRDVTKVGANGTWSTFACPGSTTAPCPDTKNSFRHTFLTDGDHYQYYVEATNAGGVSAPSNTVSAYPAG